MPLVKCLPSTRREVFCFDNICGFLTHLGCAAKRNMPAALRKKQSQARMDFMLRGGRTAGPGAAE